MMRLVDTVSMNSHGLSAHPTHQQTPAASAPPLFRGMWASTNREFGVEKREGGPMKWEAQAVRRENGQRHLSLPVFFGSFFLHPPTNACYTQAATTTTSLACKCEPEVVRFDTISSTTTSLASKCERRWFFSSFRRDSHHHYLPRVQTRAGGSHFRSSNTPPTTTTSLASKRELEVVFYGCSNTFAATTSLASKREPEVVIFVVPTRLPPPPPSRPNASRRWSFFAVSTRPRMIGRDTREEGQGATTTFSSSFLGALINETPSYL